MKLLGGNKMPEYKIDKYTSKTDLALSALTGLAGLVSTAYALATQDQETAIAGGALLTGGAILHTGEYVKAYCKAKVEHLIEQRAYQSVKVYENQKKE